MPNYKVKSKKGGIQAVKVWKRQPTTQPQSSKNANHIDKALKEITAQLKLWRES